MARLTNRHLNRATLARQLLLERATLDVGTALEHIGGLQAQEPASPYLALWSRLADFEPPALQAAILQRHVVKATLMRVTVHLVTTGDYPRLIAALGAMIQSSYGRRGGGDLDPAAMETITAAVIDHTAEPRTLGELRDLLGIHAPEVPTDGLLSLMRRRLALIHTPSPTPWSFARRPTVVAAGSWLPDAPRVDADVAVAHLLGRYLGAFGPATLADAAQWSGLTVAALRIGLEHLDRDGRLVRYSDEAGRTLFDLVDAPRPDPDVPAPVRLLPMWDSLLLAHADRSRVVSDEHRARVIARNGDVAPTFLVDGQVAGMWWGRVSPDGGTTVELEPFSRLPDSVMAAVTAEAGRLAAWIAPHERGVFGRYRGSAARRSV